ncbi:cation transporter [Nesterenkonia sp. AN1]|uniref:Multicomponent Na+:H+ antiporter subunit E n=1 Tax=Nesterenkonia aurantiaca TaxID=1436010 RepID=A0A4R7G840_9MICC|nr:MULTISPECIES: Na+/H+ antiporter subunit E [Nesterenkonia]EXF24787.1 cation transporter [Nesterenkonia sp. AN1]TDS87803.1 multicomponent Na+:H+ antiporter subunit E [Nesterenkonia aurantiaca]
MSSWILSGVLRATVLGLLWWALSGAGADYLIYGLVSVVLATAMSLALLPPSAQISPRRWPRQVGSWVVLLGWFLGQSVRGGLDVARRVLTSPVDIDPEVVVAPFELEPGHARQLALAMMNLMPGSMVQQVVSAEGEPADNTAAGPVRPPAAVQLHTLSVQLDPAEQWARLQRRVGAAFGE